jgi:tetratricopeptide (TPR) repeat protein
MKKSILILFSLLAVSVTYAQKSAVTNAVLYHQENQLDKATSEINKAIEHEKTSQESKTWYYRGLIYQSIIKTQDHNFKAIADNPEKIALESFQKSMTLDPKKGEYYKLSQQNMATLYPDFINKGYGFYNTSNFAEALACFESAQEVNPGDTTGYIYAMYAAEELQRYDLISQYISKLEAINYKNPQLYLQKISIASISDNNPIKALEISKKALSEFPGNPDLLEAQTNILLDLKKNDEALNNLKVLTALQPQNPQYLLVLASVYNQKNDPTNALSNYKKVLSLQPDNFNALYSTAVIYYDKGKNLYQEIHQMNIDDYQTHGKDKESEMEQAFSQAKEIATKALSKTQDGSDQDAIRAVITQIDKLVGSKDDLKKLRR